MCLSYTHDRDYTEHSSRPLLCALQRPGKGGQLREFTLGRDALGAPRKRPVDHDIGPAAPESDVARRRFAGPVA